MLPTPLSVTPPMLPKPLSVAPPMLPMVKPRQSAALSSDAPTDESDEHDESNVESVDSGGFSYSSSDHDDDDDKVIDLSADYAARLSSPLNEAFTAVDTGIVWLDCKSAAAYVRDVEARRSKELYMGPGSNATRRYLRCSSSLADGVIKAKKRGPRTTSEAVSRPAHQADAITSEETPEAPPILLAAPAPIAESSDPFGGYVL
jgi:hypothetical protein